MINHQLYRIRCWVLALTAFAHCTAIARQYKDTLTLPPPYATKSARKFVSVVGWKDGKMSVAPEGFQVSKFADNLENPRWLYVAPNGDLFVAEAGTRIPKRNKAAENCL